MTLRSVLFAIGVLSLLGAMIAAFCGFWPPVLWLSLNGLALTAGIVWERWRYRAIESSAPGAGWQRTDERFVDPETGKLTEVWYQPVSGERRYVVRI